MSATLVKAPCGCTVRGNRHTWEYPVHTVEIRDRYGCAIRTVDVPAQDAQQAEERAAARGIVGGVRVYPASWTYHSLGYFTMRGQCCTTARACTGCINRAIDGIFMP